MCNAIGTDNRAVCLAYPEGVESIGYILGQSMIGYSVTKEQMQRIRSLALSVAVKTSTINTQDEADRLTKGDLMGKRWKVGDEYYPIVATGKQLEDLLNVSGRSHKARRTVHKTHNHLP